MRYELTDLRLFLAIAEAGSLSAGAETVHLTASAASYRLKNLEHAMGTPLFKRLARGMELTAVGVVVLEYVRELIAGLVAMHGEVNRFAMGLRGDVKVAANSSSFNGFVVPSLSRFLSTYPHINVILKERPSEAIVPAVIAREIDVGILAGRVTASELISYQYAVDELILVAPLNHPISSHKSIRFESALSLDFVSTSENTSNYLFLRQTALQLGKMPNVRLHVHHFNAILKLVAEGVGVALVPKSVARAAIDEKRLAMIRLNESWAVRELTLVVRKTESPSVFVETLADFLLSDPLVKETRPSG